MALFRRRKNNTDSEPEVASENLETDTPRVGPYDEADAPEDLDNIDAGSLRLPVVDGIKLQFSVDKARQTVLAALYQTEDSGVQIQAFAAPKSNGIWESVRADVAQSIVAQGGRFTEAEGEYGKELRAMMPGPDANTRIPVRFIGIDGPRWLLRVGVTGRAALDNDVAAELFHSILDKLVVVRGSRPLPVRDLIPIELPAPESDAEGEAEAGEPNLDHLPARGPEISEVR